MSLLIDIAVCAGGGLGASGRYLVELTVRRFVRSTWPWATFAINVTGSCALGVVWGLLMRNGISADQWQILAVGFCGGYTTFSAAMVDTVRLLQERRYFDAGMNAMASTVICMLAVLVGYAIAV